MADRPGSEGSRFMLFAALRLGGVLVFLAGVFIAFTGLVAPEGLPVAGSIIAVIGALEAVFAPKLLKLSGSRE